ncbi:MAG: hypothetical protein K8R46_14490 [Pirellulales bacterium]|nr:hypothetical protein [Pirellulales bacterium]
MSTRERWIVYPLLFLTLGVALRDKILPPTRFGGMETVLKAGEIDVRRIRCGEIQAGRAIFNQLEAGRSQCRELIVVGPDGRPVIAGFADPESHNGTINTFSADGRPLVLLRSTDAGGLVATLNPSGRFSGIMGNAIPPPEKQSPPEPPSTEQPTKKEKAEQPADNRDQ